jgi:GrpB-like predicted nucleotidyltransferase (UPF0157 family)
VIVKTEIVVESYKASWVDDFDSIRALVWPKINDVAKSIEHVGSTSVPGLAAKPIIDVDVVISDADKLPLIIDRLQEIGYVHRGNLGIEGREAFRAPANSITQNFYVCLEGCLALRNHIVLRDHLLANSVARQEYGDLKRKLASEFANDIDSYVEAKTNLILKILASHGIPEIELAIIRNANLKPRILSSSN